jgi:hypothetical protein
MLRFLQYYGRFQGVRGNLTGMPQWARAIVAIFAIPGLLLIGLSLIALVVSILALLLLTVPVYRMLSAIIAPSRSSDSPENPPPQDFGSGGFATGGFSSGEPASAPRRHVEVKIIE